MWHRNGKPNKRQITFGRQVKTTLLVTNLIWYILLMLLTFFLQKNNQNDQDKEKKLDKPSQAGRLQPSCEENVQSVLQSAMHTNAHVPHPSQTQLNSASNCINNIKEERQHYSSCEKQSDNEVELFNHQEREVTVNILEGFVSSCHLRQLLMFLKNF